MAINFNALPDNANNNALITGKHLVTIKKAEMKTPKTPKTAGKPDYLNLQYEVFDKDGKSLGNIFDIISESEHALVQYKLKRFIIGFGIPVQGTFELKDLCKVAVGKSAYAELTIQKSDNYPDKTVVDATKDEIFYPVNAQAPAEETLEEAMADMPFFTDDEDEEF